MLPPCWLWQPRPNGRFPWRPAQTRGSEIPRNFPADSLESAGKGDQTGAMEHDSTLQHETTLEHALDVARANQKEAQRLVDEARASHSAGDIGDERVAQLERLLELANVDLRRVMKEQ